MMLLAWIFLVAAIGLQLLNIVWAIQSLQTKNRISQVHLVPVILWYVALVLRGKGFFIASSGQEILWVFAAHVLLSAAVFVMDRFNSRRA